MKTLRSWFNPVRLRRIALIFISGVFLFVSTACSSNKPPLASSDEAETVTQGQDINLYDTIQEEKSGINNYDDTLTTTRSERGEVKAKALIDNSKRIKNTTDNTVVEAIKDIPDGAQEFASDAKENIASSAKDLKRSAEDYPERTQDNLARIGDYAQDKADEAVDNAQDAAKTAAKRTKARAADLKENVEELVD